MPGALDSLGKKSLMRGTDSAYPAGKDFSAFGNKVPQELSVLEVDIGDLLSAELAYSLTPQIARSKIKIYIFIGGSDSVKASSAAGTPAAFLDADFFWRAALSFSERFNPSSMRTER
jgi:hypothetical protein